MENKVIGLLVFSVLLLSIFSGIVAAADAWENIKGSLSNTFDKWSSGDQSDIFIKILLLIMISLLVFSVLDSVGIFGNQNKVSLFIISLVVGILSTYYMTTLDLLYIGQIYNSFGGALVTLVPFLIIGSFTMRAIIDGNVQLMVMQHVAWGLFAAFLIYTMLTNHSVSLSNPIYFVVLILTLALTFLNGFALDWFNKTVLKAKIISSSKGLNEMATGARILKELGKEARE